MGWGEADPENGLGLSLVWVFLGLSNPLWGGVLKDPKNEVAGADPGEVKWVNFHPPFF